VSVARRVVENAFAVVGRVVVMVAHAALWSYVYSCCVVCIGGFIVMVGVYIKWPCCGHTYCVYWRGGCDSSTRLVVVECVCSCLRCVYWPGGYVDGKQ